MALTLIGLNHRTAPVQVRERLSIPQHEVFDLVRSLGHPARIQGAAVLSTCNRVELTLSADGEDIVEPAVAELARRAGLPRDEMEKHLYVLRHADVIRHLFRVASGLDSMIVGEPQIGGQMRDAYQNAKKDGTLDALLHKVYEVTMRVAKRVRTDTGIGENAVSVPFAAVELARKIFGDLTGLTVTLVGAGEMGELTAEHLHGFGVGRILVVNRSIERAQNLAARFEGKAVPFEELESTVADSDIVIASTSSTQHVITADLVQQVAASRRARNLFLIDLSVPRNIDPAISEVPGAYLYDIDDLQEVADANRQKRAAKALVAEEIIETEVAALLRRLSAEQVVPTILELQTRLEEIRKGELERCLRRLGPLSTEQREAVEALSRGIINKVLHYPVLRLKESAAEEAQSSGMRDTILKIFGLR